jgi:AcrR family transcriptional regulator
MSTIENAEIVKMKIANALVNLMFDNDYNSVSVIDIVKEADASRATFYRHFPNKESVLNYCFDNIVLRFYRSVSMDFKTREGYREAISHTFRTIKIYKKILRATIVSGNSHLIRTYIDEQYANAYRHDGKVDMIAYIYSGAFSNVIIKWLEENCETPIDEIVDSVVKVTCPR